jgi:hypothetical protein
VTALSWHRRLMRIGADVGSLWPAGLLLGRPAALFLPRRPQEPQVRHDVLQVLHAAAEGEEPG